MEDGADCCSGDAVYKKSIFSIGSGEGRKRDVQYENMSVSQYKHQLAYDKKRQRSTYKTSFRSCSVQAQWTIRTLEAAG